MPLSWSGIASAPENHISPIPSSPQPPPHRRETAHDCRLQPPASFPITQTRSLSGSEHHFSIHSVKIMMIIQLDTRGTLRFSNQPTARKTKIFVPSRERIRLPIYRATPPLRVSLLRCIDKAGPTSLRAGRKFPSTFFVLIAPPPLGRSLPCPL